MKVLVFLADGFEEIEALTPIDVLRRAGSEVIVAGVDKLQITGAHEIKITCDCVLSDVDKKNWDAVVCPGGMPGAVNLANSSLVNSIIMETYNAGRLVCAICASPAVVLAPLGILDGKKAVCYPGCEDKNWDNVKFCLDKVARDCNIITACGAGCALKFAYEIVTALYSREKAEDLSQKMMY